MTLPGQACFKSLDCLVLESLRDVSDLRCVYEVPRGNVVALRVHENIVQNATNDGQHTHIVMPTHQVSPIIFSKNKKNLHLKYFITVQYDNYVKINEHVFIYFLS